MESYLGPHGYTFYCVKLTEQNIESVKYWCFGKVFTNPNLCINFWGFGDEETPNGVAFIEDWIVQGPDDYFESVSDENFNKIYKKICTHQKVQQ